MRLPAWARGLAAVLLLAAALAGHGQQAPAPRRVFHLDLHTLGAVGLQDPAPAREKDIHSPDTPSSLTFLDNATLAVSFPIFNPRTVLSTRNDPQGGSHLFHTAVLDLGSGRVVAETSWGTANILDRVLALSPDRFLVRSGGKLAVVSRDWKKEREYDLGEVAGSKTSATVMITPRLETMFVIRRLDQHHEQVDVLSTETLTQMYRFRIESIGIEAASDSYFAYLLPAKKGYALFVVPVAALGKETSPALQPLYVTQDDTCIHPFFVTDDLLVLTGNCESLKQIAVDGRVRAQQSLGGNLAVLPAAMSLSERRFAVWVFPGWVRPYKTEGAPDPVMVYEATPLLRVAEVELARYSDEKNPRLVYGLSPDGSRLAVLQGFDLSVYQLPPAVATGAQAPVGPPSTTSPQAGSAQLASAGGVAGTDAGNSSDLQRGTQVQVQHRSDVDVSVSLSDLRQDAIRAWVHVTNRGATDVALAPEKPTLETLNPEHKVLPALNPDKLATAIRRVGEDDAEHARYGCEPGTDEYNLPPCPKARASASEIERTAETTAADVRSSALRAQVLKPGEQVQGAIFFTYQKKRGESVLRLPIGDQVFEFRFPEKR